MNIQRLSHIGICVSDLQRSVTFYREALGFAELSRLQVEGEQSETLLEIRGGKLEAVYLERDDTRIELLYYPEAGVIDIDPPPPMNRVGLSHLSMRVADIDQAVRDVETAGGHLMGHTRVDNAKWGTHAAFVTDPDGLRIELLQAPGDPGALPGS